MSFGLYGWSRSVKFWTKDNATIYDDNNFMNHTAKDLTTAVNADKSIVI